MGVHNTNTWPTLNKKEARTFHAGIMHAYRSCLDRLSDHRSDEETCKLVQLPPPLVLLSLLRTLLLGRLAKRKEHSYTRWLMHVAWRTPGSWPRQVMQDVDRFLMLI